MNNTAVATTTIYKLGGYDLALRKEIIDDSGVPYEHGDEIYYRITISNTGQLAADIDLLDEIPVGTAYIAGSVQASGDGTTHSLSDSGGQIRWLGDMGAGGVEVASFGVTIISPQGVDCGTVRNEAQATITGVSYHWTSQIDFHVLSPDLGVSIDAPQYAIRESESVMDTYSIIVTYQNDDNHLYPDNAYTTVLTVTLPNNNALLWESDLPPTQQNSGQEWVWNLGAVIAGSELPIEITIQPNPAAGIDGDYAVHAEIHSQTPECCQPNQPEEADARTYLVDMNFQKSAVNLKQFWLAEYSYVSQEYYLRFEHHNADPSAPDVDSYHVHDVLPASLEFEFAISNPTMDIDPFTTSDVDFDSLQPLHVGDSAWIRMYATAETLQAGEVLTNSALLLSMINDQRLDATVKAISVVPIFPPLITFPEDGELCGGEVNVRGVAQSGTEVVIYKNNTPVAWVQVDQDGHFTGTVTTYSFYSTDIFARARYYDENDQTYYYSEQSNLVAVRPPKGHWCPQRSHWNGTVKAGSLQGLEMSFQFRDANGNYSTDNWQIPGVYGFWDTDLYIYACCQGRTATISVTADGVEYSPVDIDGPWHHFQIDRAHNVKICSECFGDEPQCTDGDILIDPDGYVFDVDQGGDYSGEGGMFNPVEAISGVTVTCMVSMPQWGGWVPWPAHLYEDQVNPQVTDDVYPDNITTTGYYAFFTPPGFYYIDVQGGATTEGSPYQTWRSPVVEVITEIVHVNVPYTPWPEQVAVTVTLTADGPDQAVVTIPAGNAVQWVSALTTTDTITDLIQWSENPILRPLSDLDPLLETRGWDAGYLEPGRVYRREFAWPGTYLYTDAAGHTGQVIVTGEPPGRIYLPLVLK